MKSIFLYTTPHRAHAILADNINAKYINNGRKGILKVPFFGKIIQSIIIQGKIPKCDFILCEGTSTDLFAGSIYKCFHPKTKIICIVADPKIPIMKTLPFFDKFTLQWSLEKADLLLPISKMMLNYIPKEYKKKCRIFNPGAEVEKYLKYKTELKTKNLVFIGLLSKHKGIDIMINYFSKIKADLNNSKLFVIGDGPLSKLDKKDDQIVFLGRKKSPVIEYHKYASIYVNLARIEPAGLGLIEAMCMGLVPIVSEGVGYKEVVEKISKELIVKNDKEFEIIVKKLLKNKSLMRTYSNKSIKIAKKYNEENSIQQFKEAIKLLEK
jgi:glycosyltransferase involved in cell wall biosynthesis